MNILWLCFGSPNFFPSAFLHETAPPSVNRKAQPGSPACSRCLGGMYRSGTGAGTGTGIGTGPIPVPVGPVGGGAGI